MRLTGREVALELAPTLGRVTAFGPISAASLLWLNPAPDLTEAWPNWGGDKLWPTAKPLWPSVHGRAWPPDGVIDGQPWTLADHGAAGVELRSAVSADLGVRVVREARFPSEGPQVVWRNRIERVRASPHPVQVWAVSQVRPPQAVWLGDGGTRSWTLVTPGRAAPPRLSHDAELSAWQVPLDRPTRWKVGTMGAWIAVAWEHVVWIQRLRRSPEVGAVYPEASCVQVFACDAYVEVETLSPLRDLEVGQALEAEVAWFLWPIPRGVGAREVLGGWLKCHEGDEGIAACTKAK